MIPKVIHYCWFGGKQKDKLSLKCIESWKKYCPDYEIIEWNESNYDITKNQYMYEAYQAKKWAFVSDYVRLDVIYNFGGIYLDTDVEIIKPIDNLLNNKMFCCPEKQGMIVLGLGFGAEVHNTVVQELRNEYNKRKFTKCKKNDLTPAPVLQNDFFINKGYSISDNIQNINGITIYPSEYMCPKDNNTGRIIITKNTYTIHHYNATWDNPLKRYINKTLYSLFGEEEMIGIKTRIKRRINKWIKK